MKAAVLHEYGPPDNLRVEEVPDPECGPDDVLVDVHAAAVNPVDYKIRAGYQRAAVRLKLPTILGMDVSGVVAQVGADVEGFAVGDEVWSSPSHKRQGCYAERVAIRASEVAKKPASLSHAEAASIPLVGLTAWESLVEKARLEPGEKVLIEAGAGGVGSFAIQLAKALDAEVATTCSTRNVGFVKELGADHVVDYTEERFEEALPPQDVFFDMIGGDNKKRGLDAVRRGGRLVSINSGLARASKKCGPYLGLMAAGAGIAGFWTRARTRGIRAMEALRPADGAMLARIGELVDAGKIRAIVGKTYALDEIAEAHREIEGGHVRGKLVIALR